MRTDENQKPKLVDAPRLIKELWEPESAPRLGLIRAMQKRRQIPFIKFGRRIFFDVEAVRDALNTSLTIKPRGAK